MAVTPNSARLKKLMGITNDVPHRMNTITVSGTTRTLEPSESGAIVFLAGGISTITLPAPADGLYYEVYATTAVRHVVQAQTNVINGNYRHNSATTTMTRVAVTNQGKMTLHTSGRAIGDRLQFWSDGTNWWLDGIVNNELTVTTV